MFVTELQAVAYTKGTLKLTKPEAAQASIGLTWLLDPEVSQYMGANFSNASLVTEEKRIRDTLADPDTLSWMIELDGRIIGNVEVNSIAEMTTEYGIKAGRFSTIIGDKTKWGQGIGPAAKAAVMDWGFGEGKFELFVARALVENERSWRSLERMGFEFQALTPDTVNNEPREWRVYTMSRDRWMKQTEAHKS